MKKKFLKVVSFLLACFTVAVSCPVAYAEDYSYLEVAPKKLLYCDVDLNDKVNVFDALIVLRVASGHTVPLTAAQEKCGDVDVNGRIEAADALAILQCSVGSVNPQQLNCGATTWDYYGFVPLDKSQYWCYKNINEDQKYIYNIICDNAFKYTTGEFLIGDFTEENGMNGDNDSKYSSADLKIAYFAVVHDRPDIFWLPNTYNSTIYTKGSEKTISMILDNGEDTQNSGYLYSFDDSASILSRLQVTVNYLLNKIVYTPKMSDYDIAQKIHDVLTVYAEYDTTAANSNDSAASYKYPYAWGANGVLLEKKAVCEGFARAYQFMLYNAGINCILVSGNTINSDGSDGGGHMWTMVEEDGKWFETDITWDQIQLENKIIVAHSLFNQPRSVFSSSRTYAKDILKLTPEQVQNVYIFNYALPDCNTLDNYFTRNNLYFDSVNDFKENAVNVFAEVLKNGNREIGFEVKNYNSSQTVYNGIVEIIDEISYKAVEASGVDLFKNGRLEWSYHPISGAAGMYIVY